MLYWFAVVCAVAGTPIEQCKFYALLPDHRLWNTRQECEDYIRTLPSPRDMTCSRTMAPRPQDRLR